VVKEGQPRWEKPVSQMYVSFALVLDSILLMAKDLQFELQHWPQKLKKIQNKFLTEEREVC